MAAQHATKTRSYVFKTNPQRGLTLYINNVVVGFVRRDLSGGWRYQLIVGEKSTSAPFSHEESAKMALINHADDWYTSQVELTSIPLQTG